MQPELCPKLLTFRGDELFKEGYTLTFLEHASLISCLLSHRPTPAQMDKPPWWRLRSVRTVASLPQLALFIPLKKGD